MNKISHTVYDWDGEMLEITKISRLDMGAYLCIASNTVPPSVSKRIKVSVDCEYKLKLLNLCCSFKAHFWSIEFEKLLQTNLIWIIQIVPRF